MLSQQREVGSLWRDDTSPEAVGVAGTFDAYIGEDDPLLKDECISTAWVAHGGGSFQAMAVRTQSQKAGDHRANLMGAEQKIMQ